MLQNFNNFTIEAIFNLKIKNIIFEISTQRKIVKRMEFAVVEWQKKKTLNFISLKFHIKMGFCAMCPHLTWFHPLIYNNNIIIVNIDIIICNNLANGSPHDKSFVNQMIAIYFLLNQIAIDSICKSICCVCDSFCDRSDYDRGKSKIIFSQFVFFFFI